MSMGTQRKRHPQLLRLITLGRGDETIESLAATLGVSEKTVRRDIAGLRQLGIAIEEHVCQHGRKTYSLSRESIDQVRQLRMRSEESRRPLTEQVTTDPIFPLYSKTLRRKSPRLAPTRFEMASTESTPCRKR
ncbi:Helix-turn-helix, type 11 domain protein [Rhodopirellula maiorica SM1]|uniref:Helix-turn-helix, type 11 domain protein n=1 Tax=Rhodopirellula maiorica SM1 TaxID=1265738 RepID=M5RPY5_9BACT|nr:helix-turn-helix domain-containing protein [Rhodopirellula maiorica]EMI21393.1 Helix-turn-helix, type 11 domain protein [Rhodopirellula maiorica SM1]